MPRQAAPGAVGHGILEREPEHQGREEANFVDPRGPWGRSRLVSGDKAVGERREKPGEREFPEGKAAEMKNMLFIWQKS